MTERVGPSVILQLEVVGDDENPATPAELDAVATELYTALTSAGYDIQPAYTGTRGGDLFDIILSNADKIADLTEKVVGIVGVTVTVVQKLRAKSAQKGQEAQPATLKLAAKGQSPKVTTTLEEQQLELEQLRAQIKQLEEKIEQNQVKATVHVQQPKRKKRP